MSAPEISKKALQGLKIGQMHAENGATFWNVAFEIPHLKTTDPLRHLVSSYSDLP